jgi:GNAT superfamily N-acetyltransferase
LLTGLVANTGQGNRKKADATLGDSLHEGTLLVASVLRKLEGVSHIRQGIMGEIIIREMEQDDDFAAWYSELIEQEEEAAGRSGGPEQRYLMLSNEIGDWIGGLRYWLRGGVAHLVDVVVLPQERRRGHAHRLLAAFEERAVDSGAHLAEFWTDDGRSEGLLAALGWNPVFRRENYIGQRPWTLMEKRLPLPS